MSSAMDADQRYFMWVNFLKSFTMPDRYQPVFGAVDDVGMTIYIPYPLIGAKVKTQHKTYRQYWKKPFHHFCKTIIRCIKDKVAGFIVRGNFSGETAAYASSIRNDMMFRIGLKQRIVNKLHVTQHFFFTAPSGTFPKPPVINQYHVIIVTVKVARIFSPPFYAPAIAVEIKDQAGGLFPVKMQPIDPDTGFNIKKIFFERNIIFELEILFELFRVENEFLLEKIDQDGEDDDAKDDIPDEVDK